MTAVDPENDPLWTARQAAVERIRPSNDDPAPQLPPSGEPFIVTKQHRRFTVIVDELAARSVLSR